MKTIFKLKPFIWVLHFGLLSTQIHANQQIIQEVLDGSTLPQFVEPLPLSCRVDGTKNLTITAKECQQQILPNCFYEKLPSHVVYKSVETGEPLFTINPRKGTYVWAYEVKDGKKTYGPFFPGPDDRSQTRHKNACKV